MKLYIAEKPSLGRAIADALPKPHQRGEGFIRVGNGDVVSWCIGHLLEQAEPEAYNSAYKQWRLEHLPIVPEQWQLKPKASTGKQLSVLRKWVGEADTLVHAGDPDREGQLLVDQVIDFLGVSRAKRATVQRCLISDMNVAAVSRALNQLRPNSDFASLSRSALARSRADWLYGINMTRAYTLQGRKVGYQGLLSVGRVQTPILGLVVHRDREIECFVPKPYYQVDAHLETASGEHFCARWQPSDACQPYMDSDGRVLNKALANNVIARIADSPATVTSLTEVKKSQAAALPYNLSSLQIDAAKRFGYSPKQTLDLCQTLYERHKLITYPRSDSRYLPTEHYLQAQQVLAAIEANSSSLTSAVQTANTKLKSRAWNNSKVDAHHAIIPTLKKAGTGISPQETTIYELIARQYIAQFYPKWEYSETTLNLQISGGVFVAKARVTRKLGWKALFESNRSTDKVAGQKAPNAAKSGNKNSAINSEEEFSTTHLPALKHGDTLHCSHGELLEKATQPPKRFTDASLLAAMTGIARYVHDPAVRKILKETDGLGTEATRAGILDLLFKRNFLVRFGKQIQSTEAARGLIASLPNSAATPDMTARWEATLNAISQKEASYTDFMAPLTSSLYQLISQSQAVLPSALKGIKAKSPTFKARGKKPILTAKKKPYSKNSPAAKKKTATN
ncbi:DNA topoisomerase III [Teredinibacter waterburyi]|jgi:DNA topoisomerase III, bacteria and conjugative plasmid|uniref:DNA topoisomerase III n=1 Tax=Teredinibacter waterburyi TaxID=1500538 RepID=UPI00165FC6AF|nr:DNA topoisomerase III [Teredinibacter waterburyi]